MSIRPAKSILQSLFVLAVFAFPISANNIIHPVTQIMCSATKELRWNNVVYPARAGSYAIFTEETPVSITVLPREFTIRFWNDGDTDISIESMRICGPDSTAFSLVRPESFVGVKIRRQGHLIIPIRLEQNPEGYYLAYWFIKLASPSNVETVTKVEAYLYDADEDRDEIPDSHEGIVYPSGKRFDKTKDDQDNNTVPDGYGDWDKDGVSNKIEAFEGTDPFDAASHPELWDDERHAQPYPYPCITALP